MAAGGRRSAWASSCAGQSLQRLAGRQATSSALWVPRSAVLASQHEEKELHELNDGLGDGDELRRGCGFEPQA